MEKFLKLLLSSPEATVLMIKQEIEKYKPSCYALANEVLEVYKDYANNKELFKTRAIARKNEFDAYVEVGFSEEQAMSMILTSIYQQAQMIKSTAKTTNTIQPKKEI